MEEYVKLALLLCKPEELALGWLRYEELRKLSVRQFKELNARNLKGEFFDSMVDELVKENRPRPKV